MEPLSITAATLIVTYAAQAFGGQLGEAAASGLKSMIALVRRKLSGNDAAQAALAAAETVQGPANADVLATFLDPVVKSDSEFRGQLEELVDALRKNPEVTHFITTVSGNAQVGKIANIGTVSGDVTF